MLYLYSIMQLPKWLRLRLRLWAIYGELGYIPWHKERVSKKTGGDGGVFKGTGEAIIPFLNDDAKRTFSHLFLRPGYMIRDYIRGQHERYLAPFTALLVFYSVFTLLVAVVQPDMAKQHFSDGIMDALGSDAIDIDLDINGNTLKIQNDSTETEDKATRIIKSLAYTVSQAVVLTHLDFYPEAADTQWKKSLAAVEGDLRSKGVPMFLGNFLMLWLAMSWLLKKKHGVSVSGAAAASAYVLCQFCVFMFLALAFSLGQSSRLGILVMGILLFIDYRQWLGIGNWPAVKLTVKTGLVYLLAAVIFYTLIGVALVAVALLRT